MGRFFYEFLSVIKANKNNLQCTVSLYTLMQLITEILK